MRRPENTGFAGAARHAVLFAGVLVAGMSLPAFAWAATPHCARGEEAGINRFEWSGWLELQVARLESTLTAERVEAVKCLSQFPAGQATPYLVRALKDESVDVQIAALDGLARVGARDASDAVISGLDSRSAEVRTAAARALGGLGERAASDRLVTALSDSSGEVRQAAVQALGALRDPGAIAPLMGMLDDDSKDVVVAALEELSRFADRTTVQALLDKTRDPAVKVQVTAIKALGALRDPHATSSLISLVRSPSAEVRRAALKSLGQLGDPAAVEPLHVLLTPSTGDDTLLYVIKALGVLGDKRSVDPLLMLIRRGIQPIAAADALVEIGAPASEALIRELDATDDEAYQAQLLRMLARIPGEGSAATLRHALGSGRFARESVVVAVSQIRSREMLETLALVIPELTDRELGTVLREIAPMADDRVVRPLIERYPAAQVELRKLMLGIFAAVADPQALDVVIEELGSEDIEVKRAAIFAARALQATDAVDGLAVALRSDVTAVRNEAALALAAIRHERSVEKLLAAARDAKHPARREALWALAFAARGLDAKRARRFVGEVLEDPQHPLVYVALDAAATLRPEEVDERLRSLYETGRISVKRKVLEVAQIVGLEDAGHLVGDGLRHGEQSLVAEAAWAAGTLDVDAEGAQRLSELALAPSGPVACNALAALALRGDTSAVPVMRQRIFDQSPFVASNAIWGLARLGQAPGLADLDVLMYRTENPFLRETIYRELLSQGEREWVEATLAKEQNKALAAGIRGLLDAAEPLTTAAMDDWVVIDLEDAGGRAIAEEVYLLLPDGSIKAAYSDENGKIRLELAEPGVVRQLYGRWPFEDRGSELLQ